MSTKSVSCPANLQFVIYVDITRERELCEFLDDFQLVSIDCDAKPIPISRRSSLLRRVPSPSLTQLTVTVTPAVPFSAETAATALFDAMKGFGTNEMDIIDVFSTSTNSQRQEIAKAFAAKYKKDLCTELTSELSCKFRELVLALLDTPVKFDTKQLRKAIEGVGTHEDVLIEILCSRSNSEIQAIKDEYRNMYKKELYDDLSSDTSGNFKCLLLSLITVPRDDSSTIYPTTSALTYADALYDAGEGKHGTNEGTFNRILSEQSFPQLVIVFDEYKKKYKKDFKDAIKSETSGNLEDAYLAIATLAQNAPAYFAERLYHSMKGLGTHDNDLIRLVVSRSERDLEQVQLEFAMAYGVTLESFIKDDCSGNYRNLLLALCKESI